MLEGLKKFLRRYRETNETKTGELRETDEIR